MYIDGFKYNDEYENEVYEHFKKLDSGMCVGIDFMKYESKNYIRFYVGACVSNKMKKIKQWFNQESASISFGEQSGSGGLKELIYLKNTILKFENEIRGRYNKPVMIIVNWDDAKRKKAYKRLCKYGYVLNAQESGYTKIIK